MGAKISNPQTWALGFGGASSATDHLSISKDGFILFPPSFFKGTNTMDRKELNIEEIVEQLGISLEIFKEWKKESIELEEDNLFIQVS